MGAKGRGRCGDRGEGVRESIGNRKSPLQFESPIPWQLWEGFPSSQQGRASHDLVAVSVQSRGHSTVKQPSGPGGGMGWKGLGLVNNQRLILKVEQNSADGPLPRPPALLVPLSLDSQPPAIPSPPALLMPSVLARSPLLSQPWCPSCPALPMPLNAALYPAGIPGLASHLSETDKGSVTSRCLDTVNTAEGSQAKGRQAARGGQGIKSRNVPSPAGHQRKFLQTSGEPKSSYAAARRRLVRHSRRADAFSAEPREPSQMRCPLLNAESAPHAAWAGWIRLLPHQAMGPHAGGGAGCAHPWSACWA